MKKKLLLIHPATRSPFAGFGDTAAWGMPPLALGYVAALTPKTWDVQIVDEYTDKIDLDAQVDLVGITAYSVNATRAYELAEEFRKKGTSVVIGGVHASLSPEEASNYADAIVIGEAESIWKTVISDFEKGRLKKLYHGERLPLDNLPVPRRDLISDKYEMDIIQTTRGCPFGCEFCSVTAFNGAEYRYRPVNKVLDELEWLKKKLVYFIDDNLFGSGKKGKTRSMELFRSIIDRKIKKIWLAQTSIDVANHPELLKYAYKSGCRALFIGFESPLSANLKQMNKIPNLIIGAERMAAASRAITRHGICVIASFVLGFDYDDIHVFKKILDIANEADAVQYSVLTPFPGTKLHDRLLREKRIIYKNFPEDWEKSDLDHLMIKPKNLDIVDLMHGVNYLIKKTFSRRAIFIRAIRTFFRSRSIVSALFAFNLNRDSAKIFAAQRDIEARSR